MKYNDLDNPNKFSIYGIFTSRLLFISTLKLPTENLLATNEFVPVKALFPDLVAGSGRL